MLRILLVGAVEGEQPQEAFTVGAATSHARRASKNTARGTGALGKRHAQLRPPAVVRTNSPRLAIAQTVLAFAPWAVSSPWRADA